MGRCSTEVHEVDRLLDVYTPQHLPAKSSLGRVIHVATLYCTIVALSVAVAHLYRKVHTDPSHLIYSPAQEVLEYHVVDFGKFFLKRNVYMGLPNYPTNETDTAWEDLYDFGTTAIPKHQADLLDIETEPIPGTEQYLIELDVFHQLHCLDGMRKAFYPDRYKDMWEYRADGTVVTTNLYFMHWEHCIDSLRQTLMCHADISPLQFRTNKINGYLAADLSTRHTCRNFSKIQEWAKAREAPDFEVHVAPGLVETKPNFTLQEAIDTET